MTQDDQMRNVVVTRVFDAPIREVWKAWSDPTYVMQMTVTEYGYTSDQAHDISEAGLEQCLDKMVMIFTKA
jgi:uncharacterized protein YndB with AHSA1/START domain